jgi:hypothetical protein
VRSAVTRQLEHYRLCYDVGLRRFNSTLQGHVGADLVIGRDGTVSSKDVATDLPDLDVTWCVIHAMSKLVFPPRDGGAVKVNVTILFRP